MQFGSLVRNLSTMNKKETSFEIRAYRKGSVSLNASISHQDIEPCQIQSPQGQYSGTITLYVCG